PAVTRAVCRIVAAPIAAPLPKFPIKLELDANVAEIRKVRLGGRSAVAKDDKGKVVETFATVKEFAGPRQEVGRYARGGPGGSLVFHTEVKYWSTEEDLSGITGETKLRLTALNKEDKVIDVLDGSKPEAEPAEFVDRLIRLDDSPPDVLAFVHVPRRVGRGGAVVVGATAAA